MTEKELQTWRERQKSAQLFVQFLESSPAYIPQEFPLLITKAQIQYEPFGFSWPRVSLYCETDDGFRGFDPAETRHPCESRRLPVIDYKCRDCGRTVKTYAMIVEPKSTDEPTTLIAMKLGEYPPFGSHLAKRLQKMLTKEDLDLFRKGMRSEREGHGIGAAAYFRRVVENQWKDLVTKLRDAAKALGTSDEGLKVFDQALAQQQFSSAVEMLKDAIPSKLLILDGHNPLTLLYRPLSVQIHSLTDEQCLQQAADIRMVLNELFDNIGRVLKNEEDLRAAVNRLAQS